MKKATSSALLIGLLALSLNNCSPNSSQTSTSTPTPENTSVALADTSSSTLTITPEVSPTPPATNETKPEEGTIIVNSTADDGPGTLRQAIQDSDPGDIISFDPAVFPPDKPGTILLHSGLPLLDQGFITLDASNAGVILDGSASGAAGFEITSEGNVIQGLHIVNFEGPGIILREDASFTQIGGDPQQGVGPLGQGNLISGNFSGIALSSSKSNTLLGNQIGAELGSITGNQRGGIYLEGESIGNIIGPWNSILNNAAGVIFNSSDLLNTTITRNLIYSNETEFLFIQDLPGAPATPELQVVNPAGVVSGTTCPSCIVEIFSGNGSGAEYFEGDLIADTDGSFTLSTNDPFSGQFLVATSTSPDGFTSPFSSPVSNVRVKDTSWVYYNGQILTMEDGIVATAIEIRGDQIVAVGTDEDILDNASPHANLIDLQGKTIMPGFIDAHSHIFGSVYNDDFNGGQQMLLSNGVTTTAEFYVDEEILDKINSINAAGDLRVRISLYPVHIDNCGDIRGDWYWPDYPVSRNDGAMLQIPGLKMFNDGGSCNRPAKSYEYADGGKGDLYFQADELAAMIIQAQERGYQVAIHGLGDQALETIMDAYEIALAGGPNTYHHRIEHNTLVREDMLYRYQDLDLVATIFGQIGVCGFIDGKYLYTSPPEFIHWDMRWRALLDANPDVHFAWHSDAPYIGQPKPMENVYAFATRREFRDDGSVCEPPEWAIDDVITVEEALRIMTIEGAYALMREHEIGSIKTGKLADVIILSDNPLDAPVDAIPDIQVLMTMVGGNVEHCLSG